MGARIRLGGEHLLAAGVFALGCARGAASPMTSDAGYHLLRVGNELLTGTLSAYRAAPGGEHAPLVGAVVTAFGALFAPGGGESSQLVPGCALLGLAAALVMLALARCVDRGAAVLGVALLLLPGPIVSSFMIRPDAAVAGVLLLVAIDRQMRSEDPLSIVSAAWLAVLAAPWALPAAVTLQIVHYRVARAWIAPTMAIVGVAALSWMLGDGSRGEILRGLFGEVALATDVPGTADVLRRVWGGGILFLAPLVLPVIVRETALPRVAHVAFAGSALFLLVGSTPEAFRGGSAALLPVAVLVCARIADRFPDPRGRGMPHRPVLFTLLLPLLLFLLGGPGDARERRAVRGPASRDAEVAAFLRDAWQEPGDVLASRTGALGALSGRVVRGLAGGDALLPPLPSLVVLADGLRPVGPDEHALFEHPRFLARYTPLEFRHGPAMEALDAVWVRVGDDVDTIRPEYGRALLDAWEAETQGDDEAARKWLEMARGYEPVGRGRAREGLGRLHERMGNPEEAERSFQTARERDPYAVRARGHLIDLALARGGILTADTLLTEALEFNPHLAELRGTRARLFALAGYDLEAVRESETAVRLCPSSARLLANLGIYLWRSGSFETAREAWHRAIRRDSAMLRYLGDFARAPDSIPAPPPLPLFTDAEFAPLTWRAKARAAPGEDEPGDDEPNDGPGDDVTGDGVTRNGGP